MPLVEKKPALMDAIQVAAKARAKKEHMNRKNLAKEMKLLSDELAKRVEIIKHHSNVESQQNGDDPSSMSDSPSKMTQDSADQTLIYSDSTENQMSDISECALGDYNEDEDLSDKIPQKRKSTLQSIAGVDVGKVINRLKMESGSLKETFTSRVRGFLVNEATVDTARRVVKGSLFAFHLNENIYFKIFTYVVTVMTYVVAYLACDIDYIRNGEEHYPKELYHAQLYMDYFVNCSFLLIGFVRFMVFPLYFIYSSDTKYTVPSLVYYSLRKSGIFDCILGILCIIYQAESQPGPWLRLLRMSMISIFLIDQTDSLDIMISGITNGIRSIKYTILMMAVSTLITAFICTRVFSVNDPYHFSGLGTSMWSLLEIMTLDNWREVVDINSKGCDSVEYETAYEIYTPLVQCTVDGNGTCSSYEQYTNMTFVPQVDLGILGSWKLPYCSKGNSASNPMTAGFVLNSYVLLTGILLWTLNTAAVSTGISEKIEELKEQMDDEKIESFRSISKTSHNEPDMSKESREFNMKNKHDIYVLDGDKVVDLYILRLKLRHIWKRDAAGTEEDECSIFVPHSIHEHLLHHDERCQRSYLQRILIRANFYIAQFYHHQTYTIILHFINIFSAAATIFTVSNNLDKNHSERGEYRQFLVDLCIQIVFTIDIVLRAISTYPVMESFTKSWDLVETIIICAMWPLIDTHVATNSILSAFLYSLRIVKCLGAFEFFQEVRVIMQALYSSFVAFLYVICLIICVLSHFAMAGSILFRHNDVLHFRSFWPAFQAMCQISTLDDWSRIARYNMIGCDTASIFLEVDAECKCGIAEGGSGKQCGLGWIAAAFFVVFIIVNVMILMNLLVAIIITSMEMLRDSLVHEKKMWKKVNIIVQKYALPQDTIHRLLVIFNMLDLECNGKLTLQEMTPILRIVSMKEETHHKIYFAIDKDNSGTIDFAEFVELMHLLKEAHDIKVKEEKLKEFNDDDDGEGIGQTHTSERMYKVMGLSYKNQQSDGGETQSSKHAIFVEEERSSNFKPPFWKWRQNAGWSSKARSQTDIYGQDKNADDQMSTKDTRIKPTSEREPVADSSNFTGSKLWSMVKKYSGANFVGSFWSEESAPVHSGYDVDDNNKEMTKKSSVSDGSDRDAMIVTSLDDLNDL